MKTRTTAVLLLSHGSRDPRTAQVVTRLVWALAAATGMTVRTAYLDFAEPDAASALRQLAADGFSAVRVVPLLFTAGYHLTHDVPRVVAASGVTERMAVSVAPPLLAGGPRRQGLLMMAMADRLVQAGSDGDVDGLVLASAGSSSPQARQAIETFARDLERSHGIPVEPAFASGDTRSPTQALEALAGRGTRRPAVASLFVAPGRLSDSVIAACPDVPVAEPLGVSAPFVELLVAQTRALTLTV